MRVTYSANNSGGSWWLTERDWKALETAGWEVEWTDFLGAHATYAHKDFDSVDDARSEWESLLLMDSTEQGCECCGPPHYFHEAYR